LCLGNNTASGTANNSKGLITLYGSSTYAATISPGALTSNITLGAEANRFTMPKLNITSGNDVEGATVNDPPFSIGSLTGSHLEMDSNEIMAKSDDTTPSTLSLNYDGGNI